MEVGAVQSKPCNKLHGYTANCTATQRGRYEVPLRGTVGDPIVDLDLCLIK